MWLSSDFIPQLSGSSRQDFWEETSHRARAGLRTAVLESRAPCCLVLALPGHWRLGPFTALEGGKQTLTMGSGLSVQVGRLTVRHLSPNMSSMQSQWLTGRDLPELSL